MRSRSTLFCGNFSAKIEQKLFQTFKKRMQIFGGLWPPCPTSLTYRNYYDQVNHVLLCVFQCPLVAGILSSAMYVVTKIQANNTLEDRHRVQYQKQRQSEYNWVLCKTFYLKKFPMFQHYQCVQLSALPSYYQPRFLTPKDANKMYRNSF